MTPLPNIALVGHAGAGKTTAARLLEEHFEYQCQSIAAPLKDIARQLWGPGAERDRGKLQALGKAVREIDEDSWINLLGTNAAPGRPIVVDDVRFPNEVDYLAARGFVFVRLKSTRVVQLARLQNNGKLQHPDQLEDASETALDEFAADYNIHNNLADKQHLLREVTAVLNKECARV